MLLNLKSLLLYWKINLIFLLCSNCIDFSIELNHDMGKTESSATSTIFLKVAFAFFSKPYHKQGVGAKIIAAISINSNLFRTKNIADIFG